MTAARLSVCALLVVLLVPISASAANRKVDIVNKTGMTLKEFYASTTDTNSWEEDILGEDELENGETVEVNIDDGTGKCVFDFKGVFSNGKELVRRKVNVCQISTFTFLP